MTAVCDVLYGAFVPSQAAVRRSYGRVFNEVAEDYDRHRPSYPDGLIHRACEAAGIGAGDSVLEIGCGTGQLTRSLLARGLRVTAVEPGHRLIARVREQLDGVGDVQLVNARLEDAVLPRAHYSAVFSASAIHWIDPDVTWAKAADALIDGGSLALISYFGLVDPRSACDQQSLRAVIATPRQRWRLTGLAIESGPRPHPRRRRCPARKHLGGVVVAGGLHHRARLCRQPVR
ncbi:MAG: methyltransferase domain-containing protein [Solirubrobacterales bacterium]|nr:methyltransferase domain-containing protein [Solirubrobacterales bacterium]